MFSFFQTKFATHDLRKDTIIKVPHNPLYLYFNTTQLFDSTSGPIHMKALKLVLYFTLKFCNRIFSAEGNG